MIANFNKRLRTCLPALFSLFLAANLSAQTIEQARQLADQQFEQGNYDLALRTYQRILFFEKGPAKTDLFLQTAQCYLRTENYKRAANYFDLAYNSTQVDSLQHEYLFLKTSCYLYLRSFNYALVELLNLPDNLPPSQEEKRNFFLGVAHFGNGEYETSQGHFLAMLSPTDSSTRAQVNALFHDLEKIRLNPKTARILSSILPGAGQLYAGDVKNGLNSFLLNGGLVVLSFYVTSSLGFVEGLISVLPWFQRYYTGGYKKAELIAAQKVEEKKGAIYRRILKALSERTP